MKLAVGYIRVSTPNQAVKGCGLEAQEQAIRKFAQANGYELVAIERDIGSARGSTSISDRPGFQRAISLAQSNGAEIIVWDASRISRNRAAFRDMQKGSIPKIIELHGSLTPGQGGMDARVARAEIEADHLIKRTSDGMARARKQGIKIGNYVNLDEARLEAVRRNARHAEEFSKSIADVIDRFRAAGIVTLEGLAAALNSEGYLTRYGKRWNKQNIRHTLSRIQKSDTLQAVSNTH